MNDRFFKQKITLFLFDEEKEVFNRVIIHKVYFRHNKKTNLIDKGLQEGSTGSITIPTKIAMIDDNLAISSYSRTKNSNVLNFLLNGLLIDKTWNLEGDSYVIEGEIKEEFELSKMRKKYQVFKVISLADNRKGGLPHLKIGVSE